MAIRSITDSGPPLTEADIDAFENKLGATLPTPYRRFLLSHNGGRPHPAEFMHEHTVSCFTKLGGNDRWDLGDMWGLIENLREFLPAGVIPIARLESSDAIVLALTGENRGRVYRWFSDGQEPAFNYRERYPHHNWEGYVFVPDAWPGHPDLKLCAEDFDEFVESFHDPNETGSGDE